MVLHVALQGFIVGSDGGTLILFERDGEGAARTYRKTKTLAIQGQPVKIRNLAVSPTEDTLLCTLENNQMYSLNLTNTELMKVSLLYCAGLCCAVLCHALPCFAMLCCVSCFAMLCCISCYAMLCYASRYTVLCCASCYAMLCFKNGQLWVHVSIAEICADACHTNFECVIACQHNDAITDSS